MALSFIELLHVAVADRKARVCLRPRAPLHLLVVAALALASTGCTTRECTEIGCTDQLGIKFTTTTGAWTDGVYELTVQADDQLLGTCTLRLPDQLPDSPGRGLSLKCGEGLRLDFASQTQCEMGCDAGACWQGCTPIPGKFEARLAVPGTPPRLELTLVRDGQPILAEQAEPAYQDVYPNGPECGGACRQATLAYTVP
jgi:hypothetical protein